MEIHSLSEDLMYVEQVSYKPKGEDVTGVRTICTMYVCTFDRHVYVHLLVYVHVYVYV